MSPTRNIDLKKRTPICTETNPTKLLVTISRYSCFADTKRFSPNAMQNGTESCASFNTGSDAPKQHTYYMNRSAERVSTIESGGGGDGGDGGGNSRGNCGNIVVCHRTRSAHRIRTCHHAEITLRYTTVLLAGLFAELIVNSVTSDERRTTTMAATKSPNSEPAIECEH